MPGPAELQLNRDGNLRHLLTTEGLSRELITSLLDTADGFRSAQGQPVKKSHCSAEKQWLIYSLRTLRGPVLPLISPRIG